MPRSGTASLDSILEALQAAHERPLLSRLTAEAWIEELNTLRALEHVIFERPSRSDPS